MEAKSRPSPETEVKTKQNIQLPEAWLDLLADLFEQANMQQLRQFLRSQKQQGKTLYPVGAQIFAAFHACPLEKLKVIILGQDPYHGPGQACGLSFAVPEGLALPPSLRNIYKELSTDLPDSPSALRFSQAQAKGNLSHWAEQGVLLLNSVLTVEAGRAASHAGQGWEQFTDQVIQRVAESKPHLVFLLWGAYAQKKAACIDESRHCLIRSPHPSPLSASRGFFGSRPFSRCNQYLERHGRGSILW